MHRIATLGLLLTSLGCAQATAEADGGAGDGAAPVGDAGCDRSTDLTLLRKDGPAGLDLCRIRCTCEAGPADARVSIGDVCAAPAEACAYACEQVGRGAFVAGAYCYLGPPDGADLAGAP